MGERGLGKREPMPQAGGGGRASSGGGVCLRAFSGSCAIQASSYHSYTPALPPICHCLTYGTPQTHDSRATYG